MDGEDTNEDRLGLFELHEHYRARRDSGYDWESHAYLPALRLLPAVLLCISWVAIDTWLYTWNDALANFAQLGAYFLACLGVWLIQLCFYKPRYGWPWPANNSFQDQLRSLPKILVLLVVVGSISAAGVLADLVSGIPVSFTLLAVSTFLFAWWWLAGTRGRLFRADSDRKAQELGFPFWRRVWELMCRHYYLVLASIGVVTSLTPIAGLISSDFFADKVVLLLTLSLVITICMFFDERRLRRL